MWPGGTQAYIYIYIYIVNARVKWYMPAKFHVSRCKSLSLVGKDTFLKYLCQLCYSWKIGHYPSYGSEGGGGK